MKRENHITEKLLDQLETPMPPEELKSRTLQAAMEALQKDEEKDVWTKVWENRGFRMAWIVSLSLLFAAHLFLTLLPSESESSTSVRLAKSSYDNDPELAAIAKLPQLKAELPSFNGSDQLPVAHTSSE